MAIRKSNSDTAPVAKAGATRVRGRPRAFCRETALERATRLFWCKGYEATSIADLTEAMGIASPSLYAAFGSKEALYAEALAHYDKVYGSQFWTRFLAATTVREAVGAYLMDTATRVTPDAGERPSGCMVTLSTVGSEGHAQLGDAVGASRADGLGRLTARIEQGVADGEIPASIDVLQLARFVQTVQNGMAVMSRNGASRAELEGVACIAMQGWDAHLAAAASHGQE